MYCKEEGDEIIWQKNLLLNQFLYMFGVVELIVAENPKDV